MIVAFKGLMLSACLMGPSKCVPLDFPDMDNNGCIDATEWIEQHRLQTEKFPKEEFKLFINLRSKKAYEPK